MTTFDQAQEALRSIPTAASAQTYLNTAIQYWEDEMIGDDTFFAAQTEIAWWAKRTGTTLSDPRKNAPWQPPVDIERAILSAPPSSPTFAEVLEMLDNVSAIAENTILHYHPINAERTTRLEKVGEARSLCDRLLRPGEANETLFKIFQMTRRYCDDLGKELQDSMWADSGHKGIGFLYAGTYYIEIQQDWWSEEAKAMGRYHLVVERDDRITNDLESLERELFDFALINDITFEEATDDLTVDLFEGENSNAGEQRHHLSRGTLRDIIKENPDSMDADEVATMRTALVEKGTYRIVGFVGCWWDVVLVKPADPATFPPEEVITGMMEG